MDELIKETVQIIKDKKGEDIVILDMENTNAYFEAFIVATCMSPVHTKTIHDEISKLFRKKSVKVNYKNDPNPESGWVILDYNNFIIHLFSKEARNQYQLEKLWDKAKIIYST